MKSLRWGTAAANKKLRGKICVSLSCGCCDMVNFTKKERVREANKEINEFKRTLEYRGRKSPLEVEAVAQLVEHL